jgi:hypothetical protein
MSIAYFEYLDDRGLDRGGMTLDEVAALPFYEVNPTINPDFMGGHQWDYEHLPYYHQHGMLCHSLPDLILWKCFWCPYWCAMMDQRFMEEHLLVKCPGIDHAVRESYRLEVFSQIAIHSIQIGYIEGQAPVQPVDLPPPALPPVAAADVVEIDYHTSSAAVERQFSSSSWLNDVDVD